MQVQSINNQNNNKSTGFSGLYKIPNNIGENVFNLVNKYNCARVPSSRMANKYWYILTPDDEKTEKIFEKAFLEGCGKYWKVNIKELLTRQICEDFFGMRKLIDNKENWVEAEVEHGLDIQF